MSNLGELKARLLERKRLREMTPEQRDAEIEADRIKHIYEDAIYQDWSPPEGFTGPWAG